MAAYTRRDKARLEKPILGEYHDVIMRGDQAAYEALLDTYNVPQDVRRELLADFTRSAVSQMRKRWTAPK
jgi:acetyl-CoA carboxylase carboxyltransferase component